MGHEKRGSLRPRKEGGHRRRQESQREVLSVAPGGLAGTNRPGVALTEAAVGKRPRSARHSWMSAGERASSLPVQRQSTLARQRQTGRVRDRACRRGGGCSAPSPAPSGPPRVTCQPARPATPAAAPVAGPARPGRRRRRREGGSLASPPPPPLLTSLAAEAEDEEEEEAAAQVPPRLPAAGALHMLSGAPGSCSPLAGAAFSRAPPPPWLQLRRSGRWSPPTGEPSTAPPGRRLSFPAARPCFASGAPRAPPRPGALPLPREAQAARPRWLLAGRARGPLLAVGAGPLPPAPGTFAAVQAETYHALASHSCASQAAEGGGAAIL
ncbi:formin-like protein 5 [Sphaerodactylus townsendi]|uniref:formin-like protein 5 n=1 Tax=Sphaerodactylus townsendi TaxID=933632 RepID=UPI0020266DAB|nr:formin-like protein 5 [Sphaerodactylus townsendi]